MQLTLVNKENNNTFENDLKKLNSLFLAQKMSRTYIKSCGALIGNKKEKTIVLQLNQFKKNYSFI